VGTQLNDHIRDCLEQIELPGRILDYFQSAFQKVNRASIKVTRLFSIEYSFRQSYQTISYQVRKATSNNVKTAGKWQKCNLVLGMASVASDMGWL